MSAASGQKPKNWMMNTMDEITVISRPQSDIEDDEVYQQTMLNIVAGILRWLDRPENRWWKDAFTQHQSWQVYDLCIPDALWAALGAAWLANRQVSTTSQLLLWDDAMYQVTTMICLPQSALE